MKEILWAYSGIGIPIILVIQIPTTKGFRTHAITVCGHKISSKTEDDDNNKELKFSSDKISKFYAHDDQWGPFTRIKFIGENEIETTWSENDRLKRSSYVSSAIVSIYPKIRISYEDVKAL